MAVNRPCEFDRQLETSNAALLERSQRVRVKCLLQPHGDYNDWRMNIRRPAIGDNGHIIDVLEPPDRDLCYIVENCDETGWPIWVAGFNARELECFPVKAP